jgi:predicted nicotinamide N-methyase
MGNENNKQSSSSDGNKIVLRLRNRDIILHYAFKMKLVISDIALFPHELDGLRLWDTDVVVARFAILENNRFRGKDVMVFRAGVGISGIALKQWADCKNVVMCDTRDEVVQNMTNNCEKNGIRSISCIKIEAKEIFKFASKFDTLLLPDILNLRYTP